MRALLASLALLAGCGLTPRDAQFTCPDGVCPAGFSCVAGLCRLGADAPGLDAPGLDVPRLDVPLDAPPPDVPGLDAPEVDSPPIDAPVVPESCLPDARRRPVDEDADGRVDEDCPYLFATPHAVLGAMPLVAQYSGVDLTADGEFLFSTTGLVGRGVYRSRRLSFDTQYGVGVEQTTTAATARRIDALTVSGDGSELILQTTGTDEISRLYASRLDRGGAGALPPARRARDRVRPPRHHGRHTVGAPRRSPIRAGRQVGRRDAALRGLEPDPLARRADALLHGRNRGAPFPTAVERDG
jgi:hypothetical protein